MENQNENLTANTKSETIVTKGEDGIITSLEQEKIDAYLSEARLDQNLGLAIFSGIAAMLVGAILWALITVTTEFQIGFMAVGVGFLVGFAIRFAGKGMDMIYGIIGASLALIGCLLGNVFTIVGFISETEALGLVETIRIIDWAYLPDMLIEMFFPIDLLFYGIAIYEGYRFSFRQFSDKEMMKAAGRI